MNSRSLIFIILSLLVIIIILFLVIYQNKEVPKKETSLKQLWTKHFLLQSLLITDPESPVAKDFRRNLDAISENLNLTNKEDFISIFQEELSLATSLRVGEPEAQVSQLRQGFSDLKERLVDLFNPSEQLKQHWNNYYEMFLLYIVHLTYTKDTGSIIKLQGNLLQCLWEITDLTK